MAAFAKRLAAGMTYEPRATTHAVDRAVRTVVMERRTETAGSICLDACELHHLAPLLGFVGDQLAKVGGRPDEHRAAHVRKPRLQLRVGEGRVDLRVELRNDFGGRSHWCADAIPCARLVIGHELTHGRDAGQRVRARGGGYRERAQPASPDIPYR